MPEVSIIVPCYNEEQTIALLLAAVYAQSYPRQEMEVLVADGRSTDGTRAALEAFRQSHPDLDVRVVDNPQRTIPAGLNCALAAARGRWIVRLDAHSAPRPEYVEMCVAALQAGHGDNVGGVWEIQPGRPGVQARAIAAAAAHPLAVGDARYRYTTRAGLVDTVPFGAFARALIEQIGPFDEQLLTNEDYEFNARLRQSGGRVWLDPAIRSTYYARPNLAALAKQYWRYGFWKVRMLQRYPQTLRWRQALPPLFVLSVLLLAILAGFWPLARTVLRLDSAGLAAWLSITASRLLVLELGLYTLVIILVGIQVAGKRREPALIFGVPPAIAVMHFAWGGAFLWSLANLALRKHG